MKTSVWGNHAWNFLHACAYEYPASPTEGDKQAAANLFRSLGHMLPCKDCCRNYQQEVKEDPVEKHLGSRDELLAWLLRLHNKVNRRLGKATLTAEQLHEKYANQGCEVDSFLAAPCGGKTEATAATADIGGANLLLGVGALALVGVVVFSAMRSKNE